MNKTVEKIVNDKIIDQIIKNVAKNSTDEDFKDLKQDICLELLEKPEELLQGICERGQIGYYITRIVVNNINSKTSRFYYTYRKNKMVTTSMEDASITEKGERPDYD